MIELYYWPTPNGWKVTIMLEECGLPYTIKPVDIGRGDQLSSTFLKHSPNGRMPAVVDHEPMGGGEPLTIFESGAIIMYLGEKTRKFWPQEPHLKYEVCEWILWQAANQGPKFGEQGYFRRAAKDSQHGDLSFPLLRFDNEVHRLYGVLNLGLFNKPYLAAGDYTIADMICYPWASLWQGRGIDLEEFPNVRRWLAAVEERPAVKKGIGIGRDLGEDPASISSEEQARRAKLVKHQRGQAVPKEWT
jgi:GSH-dependent disulfide-bond oxidoreductase